MACADCKLWCSSAGAPICGICRASRAVRALPTDSRLTSSNYDLVQSILDRNLGEVNGWLAVPLAESAVEASPKSDSPEPGDRTGSDERASRHRSLQKEKRSDRDSETRGAKGAEANSTYSTSSPSKGALPGTLRDFPYSSQQEESRT